MFKEPQKPKKQWLLLAVGFLLCSVIFIFYLDWQNAHRGLTFAMLDVGQGDGLFIESPTGTQILFDAGSARKVMGPLSRVVPPFDRTIDAIVITNPDADHIGGFLEVLKKYKVGTVFEPGTFNDSKTYQNLKAEIKKQNIPVVLAKQGMRLDLGGGAVIDILFPDQDVSDWSANDGSIVAKLAYGDTTIMLTGDTTTKAEQMVLSSYSQAELKSTILKVAHHGSRSSSSLSFVEAVGPVYALVSVGEDSKYGHPHQETLDSLAHVGTQVFRTDLLSTIIMKSDGKNSVFSFHR